MKYKILTLAIILFSIGCNSSTNENEVIKTEEVVDSVPEIVEENPVTIVNEPPMWVIEFEPGTQKEKLKKSETVDEASFTAADIVTRLNQSFADVQLHLNKISNDTIYVKIPESEKFSHQMGSTGAYNYLAVVVYNLTELDGIKYVNLDFKEGDHAMPGVFTRDNFQNLR